MKIILFIIAAILFGVFVWIQFQPKPVDLSNPKPGKCYEISKGYCCKFDEPQRQGPEWGDQYTCTNNEPATIGFSLWPKQKGGKE